MFNLLDPIEASEKLSAGQLDGDFSRKGLSESPEEGIASQKGFPSPQLQSITDGPRFSEELNEEGESEDARDGGRDIKALLLNILPPEGIEAPGEEEGDKPAGELRGATETGDGAAGAKADAAAKAGDGAAGKKTDAAADKESPEIPRLPENPAEKDMSLPELQNMESRLKLMEDSLKRDAQFCSQVMRQMEEQRKKHWKKIYEIIQNLITEIHKMLTDIAVQKEKSQQKYTDKWFEVFRA